jgi:AcrR family transcriptional regulator
MATDDSSVSTHANVPQRATRETTVRRTRRRRDPEATREAILEAAREVLARHGKEGLSVAQVAQRAGVNRGTAYQHFQTREQLIEATAAWVSRTLYRAVFGDPAVARNQPVETIDMEALTEHITDFAMENPELGRIWLFELLSSRRPASDPFWQQYESNFAKFANTDLAQPDIDTEVVAVLMLGGSFLWPVWARAHARSAKKRQQLAKRFSRELLRLSLHGTVRPEKFPELDAHVSKRARSGAKRSQR